MPCERWWPAHPPAPIPPCRSLAAEAQGLYSNHDLEIGSGAVLSQVRHAALLRCFVGRGRTNLTSYQVPQGVASTSLLCPEADRSSAT